MNLDVSDRTAKRIPTGFRLKSIVRHLQIIEKYRVMPISPEALDYPRLRPGGGSAEEIVRGSAAAGLPSPRADLCKMRSTQIDAGEWFAAVDCSAARIALRTVR